MRWKPLALLALAAVATSATGADPVVCPPYGAPTELALEFKDFSGGTGPDIWVEATWTPAPFDPAMWEWVGWYVERRDGSGAFEHHADIGVADNPTNGLLLNFVRNAPTCAASCLEKGGTYSFRAAAKWKWRPACANYDGVTYQTTFTNEATITVPGGEPPPPDGNPPKDVLAIADPKKPRVEITWNAAEGSPEAYIVKRRQVDENPAKAGPRADPLYTEIARLDAKARKYLDKSAERGIAWSYIVEGEDAGITTASAEDRAYPPEKKCVKSSYDLWTRGEYRNDDATGDHDLFLTPEASGGKVKAELYVEFDADESGDEVVLVGEPALPERNSIGQAFDVKVKSRREDAPAWSQSLDVDNRGKLLLAFVDTEPFDDLAFRKISGRVKIRPPGRPAVVHDFAAIREFDSGGPHDTAKLCATVGPGSKSVGVGKNVFFVYDLVDLGPAPLYSRRATLDVRIENGEIRRVFGRFFEARGDPVGKTFMKFDVGAIGPDEDGRAIVASLAVEVMARTPADGKAEVRAIFTVRDESTAPGASVQDLSMDRWTRTAEVAIVLPKPR